MVSADTVWPDHLFADLDRTGPIPLYFQVSSRLEAAIRSGELPPGSRLENEIAITQHLGISRPTVRRAIQELVDIGLLVRRRGIGTQVVQGQITRQVELTSLYEDLKNTAREPGTKVLIHDIVEADEIVAERLRVPVGSNVVHLRRQRTAGGVSIAILENYLPEAFGDITTEQLQLRGLYQILRARGVTIRVANQLIGARRADTDESTRLGIDDGGPLLTMERVAYDNAGEAIEYGHHCYRPDMYSFETTLVAR
ncbi:MULTISPECIES: GntR family transcriptional regulator [Subtercola]|uniref:GntR family transcriptional regulator n=1 Tax=Subtercola vilae TaxID=2056433 RepID=A0A4T2C833_9MICO|nr:MULTISPECIES: GntR family transcriptional regulator [Subtercola]MEA9986434.1 GntR family transcriptional regulator [Subtercola sp. RTI3]TIH40387.1 GntR family transcriptional regulator [Subtercola vilae]